MLKQRIITAAILIPITLLIVIYFPPLPFALVTLALVLGAAWEWSALMQLRRTSQRVAYLMLMLFCAYAVLFIPVVYLLSLAFVWWVLAALLVTSYPQGVSYWQHHFTRGAMGALILIPCWGAVNFIRNQHEGLFILFYLFALIWGADIAAYFAGKQWGKNKLLPEVSPGKSWQGFIAALLYGVLFAAVFSWFAGVSVGVLFWALLLSIMTISFSVIGDLTESMIKRLVGVKDSGTILPGHGGLLDRIDSLTAAAPTFALGALLIGAYL
jgi:phosphatidate cytidylyltransferase